MRELTPDAGRTSAKAKVERKVDKRVWPYNDLSRDHQHQQTTTRAMFRCLQLRG